MANAGFGAIVGESGLGCTWADNSQSNRLTPWHNDPVSDPQSEIIYLRDDESGAVWTPTALPTREKDAYRARHGQGSCGLRAQQPRDRPGIDCVCSGW